MKHAIETKVTEDGIPYVGNPELGCPHCGFVDVKVYPEGSTEPTMLYYHPGAQCCEARIKDQIRYRQNELDNASAVVDRHNRAMSDLQQRMVYLVGKEKKDAEVELAKMEAMQTRLLHDMRQKMDDLEGEIREMQAML